MYGPCKYCPEGTSTEQPPPCHLVRIYSVLVTNVLEHLRVRYTENSTVLRLSKVLEKYPQF